MGVIYPTEVLIIGAGPAGLAAAAGCRARGLEFLLIEAGARVGQRNHGDQRSLGTGVGGSGLFSDGKFSFYPSATALWRLGDARALEESWRWFSAAVAPSGLRTPTLPVLASGAVPAEAIGAGGIGRKEYPSTYVNLDGRRQLIEALETLAGTQLLSGVELVRLAYREDQRLFHCDVRVQGPTAPDQIAARAVIDAGGRIGPVGWPAIFPQLTPVFKRVEVGVRLEQASQEFFLQPGTVLDPKLILRPPDNRYSWRTFCCCRDGEVVTTEVQGVLSVSGRADCAPTGLSNVGFNLRVTDATLAESLWPDVGWLTGGTRRPASQLLTHFLETAPTGRIADVMGGEVARLLADGLRQLRAAYPSLGECRCRLVAPAIEGVGSYPELNDTLRCGRYPLWVSGDATGVFRGLTAAMVSGYFAALQAAGYMEDFQWT